MLDVLTAKIDEMIEDEYDLIYLDYRDELSEEQARALASNDWDKFWAITWDWECEARWSGANYEMEDLICKLESDNPDLLEAIDEHRDELEEYVRDEIMERDSGSWLDELIDKAGPVDCMLPLINEDEAEWGEERNPLDILKALGVDETPENIALAEKVFYDAPTDLGMAWVVFPVELRDLMKSDSEPITVDEFVVCYGNPFAGGYWSVVFKGHKINTYRSEIMFDGDWGYSLQEVYGIGVKEYLRYESNN